MTTNYHQLPSIPYLISEPAIEPNREQASFKEGICQNCGQAGLVIKRLCGDCAPASYSPYYKAWYNSREEILERVILAQALLSEIALEQADGEFY